MVAYGEALKRAAEESPFDPRAYLDYEALKALLSVWKSKFYGAVVLNLRVDALVDLHTGVQVRQGRLLRVDLRLHRDDDVR